MSRVDTDPTLSDSDAAQCALLRGLRSNDFVISDVDPPEIAAEAFMPEGKDKDTVSVSLDDDDGVGRRRLFADPGNSRLGAAHLPRDSYEHCVQTLPRMPMLILDREGHDRHATLKYVTGLKPRQQRLIASALALEASHLPRPAPIDR